MVIEINSSKDILRSLEEEKARLEELVKDSLDLVTSQHPRYLGLIFSETDLETLNDIGDMVSKITSSERYTLYPIEILDLNLIFGNNVELMRHYCHRRREENPNFISIILDPVFKIDVNVRVGEFYRVYLDRSRGIKGIPLQ